MNSDWDDLYMRINCLDETKTIPLEHSFIWGHIEGVIGRKALRTLNFVTRSIASATEMRSNVDSLNIKVIPLGDMKFSHVENPFTLYLAKIRCQHQGVFTFSTPSMWMNCLLKRRGSLDPNHTILPQRAFIGARPKKSIPTWPASAAPPLAPVALSQAIGRGVPSPTTN